MRTPSSKIIGIVSVATALLGGCGDSTNNNHDAGTTGPACTAGAKECVNDRVARICPSDGSGWLVVQCASDENCQSGACAPSSKPQACTSADNGCADSTTALHCSSSGAGFDSVVCPSGTTCVGAGLCEGACVVGSSLCTDTNTVATCADGKSYTVASCGAGQACVRTADSPVATAACKAGDCTPNANGCDSFCGNKADPMAANQESTVSVCTETPSGYKWVPTTCAAPKSCSPTAGTCVGGTQAACASDCTPGDQRCTMLSGTLTSVGTGYQTCGADGKWGTAVTACNASPTAVTSLCFAASDGHAVCGDPVCSMGTGACDDSGLFHACGTDGKLATTGTACDGVCAANPGASSFFGWTPGQCVSECQPGDERCGDPNGSSQTFQVCGSDNKWGAVQACSGTDFCLPYTDAAGRPRKSCGECIPGATRCSNQAGDTFDPGSDYVEICGADGKYGDPAACTVGRCQYSAEDTASCVAECFPGSKVCIGNEKGVNGTDYSGTDEEATCTSDGKYPDAGTGTACTGDAVCRLHAGGAAAGCTVCLGSNNEYGLPDTRCADMNGDPSGNYLQSCNADGSGWSAQLTACGGSNPYCIGPSTDISPPTYAGNYCHGEFIFAEVTEHALESFGGSCESDSLGAPVSCGSKLTGTVSDCCSTYCKADPQPYSAFCGAP